MAKPLKYHQTLNLPPRSVKHGQHRRSSPPAHGYPVVGTDHSAGGSGQNRTVTINLSRWTTFAWNLAEPEPTAPALPYAGIRTGELIGHRLWWVMDGSLCSLAHRRLWAPGETIYGDTKKCVDSWNVLFPIWGGTYAFMRLDQLNREITELSAACAKVELMKRDGGLIWSGFDFNPYRETTTFVSGTIKMWGDVIEHEHGYRAEFAKLNSIDNIYGPGELIPLRGKYGVAMTSTDRTAP